MSLSPTPALRGRVFRASDRFRLILYDRLMPEQRRALGELRADPGLYGVLSPSRPADGTVKAVDRETALLLLTLREPGPLPEYALEGPDSAARSRAVAGLVLDGALEVLSGGSFVSGAEALGALGLGSGGSPEGAGAIGRLSRRALRHAALYDGLEPAALRDRLYGYNRIPLSRRWLERLGDEDAVRRLLGIGPGGPGARLGTGWNAWGPAETGGWLAWSRPTEGRGDRSTRPTYKLYVSPTVESLPGVFERLVGVLSRRAHEGLKVGADAPGLLRPDKLVVYFAELDDLKRVADELCERLGGGETHGVPFTAEIGARGMVSWGLDPPAREAESVPGGRSSWRTWVTGRLAAALWSARREGSGPGAAARLALERLRLEGVDIEGWTPSATVWSASREAPPR